MRTKTKCRAIKYWLNFCEPEHQNKLSGVAFTDQVGEGKKKELKSRWSWRYMVSENENTCNHELYTTETQILYTTESKHGLAKYTMMNERFRVKKKKKKKKNFYEI